MTLQSKLISISFSLALAFGVLDALTTYYGLAFCHVHEIGDYAVYLSRFMPMVYSIAATRLLVGLELATVYLFTVKYGRLNSLCGCCVLTFAAVFFIENSIISFQAVTNNLTVIGVV